MVVPSHRDRKQILTPGFWGRAIPLEYGVILYKGKNRIVYGGTVMGKGTSLSGAYLERHLHLDPNSDETPWGFFGDRDGKTEIEVGNDLLDTGFGTSLPLGFAVFDSQGLIDWLVERWESEPDFGKYITENIHRVIGNGDEVIYFYRVTGVTERYEQGKNPDDIKDHLYKMRYVSRRNREFARAARLMRLQLESLDPFGSKEIVETYETVGRGEKISWEQFDFFNEGLIRLFQANVRSLYEVYIRHINRGVYIRDFADVLAEARDWDFSFLSQDFEMAKKTNIQARDNTLYNLEIYTRRYAGLVSHKVPSILRSFVVPSIVSDPQLERICSDDLYWTRLTAQFSERLGAAV